MTNSNQIATLRQVGAYLAVGVGTAVFELTIFSLLYRFICLDVAISNVIAVVCATIVNFVLNGTVAFKGSSDVPRSVVLYLALFAFNTAFSTFVVSSMSRIGLPAETAKFATMVCVVAWNFILYRKVVFR